MVVNALSAVDESVKPLTRYCTSATRSTCLQKSNDTRGLFVDKFYSNRTQYLVCVSNAIGISLFKVHTCSFLGTASLLCRVTFG